MQMLGRGRPVFGVSVEGKEQLRKPFKSDLYPVGGAGDTVEHKGKNRIGCLLSAARQLNFVVL